MVAEGSIFFFLREKQQGSPVMGKAEYVYCKGKLFLEQTKFTQVFRNVYTSLGLPFQFMKIWTPQNLSAQIIPFGCTWRPLLSPSVLRVRASRRGNKSSICAEEGVARTRAPSVRARFVRTFCALPSTCAPKVLYLHPLRGSQVRAREGDDLCGKHGSSLFCTTYNQKMWASLARLSRTSLFTVVQWTRQSLFKQD